MLEDVFVFECNIELAFVSSEFEWAQPKDLGPERVRIRGRISGDI